MKKTHLRGFGALDSDTQRAIASKGGKAAHEAGVAHEYDSDEARAAGKKGGKKVAQDREWMRLIGRRGGLARQRKRKGESK